MTKAINPKDAVGSKKVPFSTVPMGVVGEIGLAMHEGARKYGRHNYRSVAVNASVYFDAAIRHLTDWWEGTDVDPDSGLSHITKALATLTVLRDAQMNGLVNDDRPPKLPEGWQQELNRLNTIVVEKYPNAVPAVTEKNKND